MAVRTALDVADHDGCQEESLGLASTGLPEPFLVLFLVVRVENVQHLSIQKAHQHVGIIRLVRTKIN